LSYTPKYTNQSLVENLLGIIFDANSVPTNIFLNDYLIKWVEAEIDNKGYGELDLSLLEEYATKKVALQVLQIRSAHEDYRVDLSQGSYAELYKIWVKRVEEIEKILKEKIATINL